MACRVEVATHLTLKSGCKSTAHLTEIMATLKRELDVMVILQVLYTYRTTCS